MITSFRETSQTDNRKIKNWNCWNIRLLLGVTYIMSPKTNRSAPDSLIVSFTRNTYYVTKYRWFTVSERSMRRCLFNSLSTIKNIVFRDFSYKNLCTRWVEKPKVESDKYFGIKSHYLATTGIIYLSPAPFFFDLYYIKVELMIILFKWHSYQSILLIDTFFAKTKFWIKRLQNFPMKCKYL